MKGKLSNIAIHFNKWYCLAGWKSVQHGQVLAVCLVNFLFERERERKKESRRRKRERERKREVVEELERGVVYG